MILARVCPRRAGGKTENTPQRHKDTKVILLNSQEILCAFVVTFLLAAVRKQVPGHACRRTLNRSGFPYERGMIALNTPVFPLPPTEYSWAFTRGWRMKWRGTGRTGVISGQGSERARRRPLPPPEDRLL